MQPVCIGLFSLAEESALFPNLNPMIERLDRKDSLFFDVFGMVQSKWGSFPNPEVLGSLRRGELHEGRHRSHPVVDKRRNKLSTYDVLL
jgi:hypothetical protein